MPLKPACDGKRLFLIDAMGYVFRAFFAPMPQRLRNAQGLPTNVPYLFANMVRKLVKDWKPDYLAVVFDSSAPTFRDKLFDAYKAQRAPMPQDLSIQVPYVRRYCEAMRLPQIECPGYEADDVIGTLAKKASEQGMQVFVVTSDKDLMQLVGDSIRLLNPMKGDLVLDAAKVEEIMGVPPEKVVEVMALMGDAIDNIPGARNPNEKPAPGERRKAGIGEVGARQLIQQYGSAEEAVKHASEVKRANYREALEKHGEFVRLSKQLATIPTDAPVALELSSLQMAEPDSASLRDLYVELGFTSLLKELAPVVDDRKTDYASVDSPAALGKYLTAVPAGREIAVWLSLDSEDPDEEGFGTRVLGIEVSPVEGVARSLANDGENNALAAMGEWFADARRTKVVHDAKLFHLLADATDATGGTLTPQGREGVAGIRHATMLYSYLLRPTTANHAFAEVVLRQLNRTLSGAPGEHADFLLRIAPLLREEVEKQGFAEVYEKIDLPLAPVLARMEAAGVFVDKKELEVISAKTEQEMAGLEKAICELAGYEFNINSPQQLAEVLFDRLSLPAAEAGKRAVAFAIDGGGRARGAGARSRAAEESARVSRTVETEIDVRGRAAAADSSGDRADSHALQPDGDGDRTAKLVESESAEYSGADGAGARDSRGVRGSAGVSAAVGGLLADRVAYPGASLRRPDSDRGVSPRRRHSLAHSAGSLRRRAVDADARAPARRESDQFRRDLWAVAVRACATACHRSERSGEVHRGIFRALQRREEISRRAGRGSAQDGREQDAVRARAPDSGDHLAAARHPQFCRAHGVEYADAGRGRRPDQAGDDRARPAACREIQGADDPAGARRIAVRGA